MGATSEPSSSAAQSAPSEMSPPAGKGGFFSRLFKGAETPAEAAPSAVETVPDLPQPGMLNLRRMRVEDVAIPTADIVSVASDVSVADLVAAFRSSGKTRLPVYRGTLDTPLGFVHLKDLALKHGFNGEAEGFDIETLARPLLFVPPSMPIGVLLTKMQADRIHMALVIDEYGGTDGLVTIEDLIEQVIGEIEDEHDPSEAKHWSEEKPGCYIAQAKTPLDEFQSAIGVPLTEDEEIDEEDIDTLGGLVFMLSGQVPGRGEIVTHPLGVEFEVIDADARRIKRLRVYVPDSLVA